MYRSGIGGGGGGPVGTGGPGSTGTCFGGGPASVRGADATRLDSNRKTSRLGVPRPPPRCLGDSSLISPTGSPCREVVVFPPARAEGPTLSRAFDGERIITHVAAMATSTSSTRSRRRELLMAHPSGRKSKTAA